RRGGRPGVNTSLQISPTDPDIGPCIAGNVVCELYSGVAVDAACRMVLGDDVIEAGTSHVKCHESIRTFIVARRGFDAVAHDPSCILPVSSDRTDGKRPDHERPHQHQQKRVMSSAAHVVLISRLGEASGGVDELDDTLASLSWLSPEHEDAGGDRGRVEEFVRQADYRFEEPGFDHSLADPAFLASPEENAVRHHHTYPSAHGMH